MLRFFVDEDLPRSLSDDLKVAGFQSEHVQEADLRGKPDDEIYRYAAAHKAILISGDLGFSNRLQFPISKDMAIVIVRFPNEIPNITLRRAIVNALSAMNSSELLGHLIVVEPGRVRIRKAP